MKISAYQLAKYAANQEVPFQSSKILQFPSVDIESSEDTLDLEKKLAHYLELKEILSKLNCEFNPLKKELKKFFEGMPESFIGDYKVTGKYRDMPAKEVGAYSWWDLTIRKI